MSWQLFRQPCLYLAILHMASFTRPQWLLSQVRALTLPISLFTSPIFESGVFLLFSVGLYVLMLVILGLANWRMVDQTVVPETGAEPQQLERFLESKVIKVGLGVEVVISTVIIEHDCQDTTASGASVRENFSQMR